MLSIDSSNEYELYLPATDMRKSFDSLSGLILTELGSSTMNGRVYLFVNRLRNKMKILHWRTGGYVLYYKRLEKGVFKLPKYDKAVKSIIVDYTQLVLLFDGINIGNLEKKERYK